MTIEIEGVSLGTEDGITTVTADVSHVIEELNRLGHDVILEEEGTSNNLDLIDSLLFADINEKFQSLNWADRERLHSLIINFK